MKYRKIKKKFNKNRVVSVRIALCLSHLWLVTVSIIIILRLLWLFKFHYLTFVAVNVFRKISGVK